MTVTERLYINNFRGRAGRTERAKHLREEFLAIEEAFSKLQALNVATHLTIYTNSTALSGTITIIPDNGVLQEMKLEGDIKLEVAAPLKEAHYRMSLLIHGGGHTVTNLWGAQTWKEYGLDSWWDLYTAEGPFASMLLDFYWDICSHTWLCVASTKNQFRQIVGGLVERHYPLLVDLANTEGDDTLGFTRASPGMIWDHHQAYHYHIDDETRFAGARYIDNWCATPSDLTSVAWVATDVTVTTDAGAGPASEDVQRLAFDVVGGKLATFVLPAFGRASRQADTIKVAVSFRGQGVNGAEDVRVFASFMGKTALTPPVHDAVQVNMTGQWEQYGVVLDVVKSGNDTDSLTLDHAYPKTLIEIGLVSPSGSAGGDIRITDVQIEVLRATDAETISPEVQDGTIGASMVLTSSGTGSWVDGTKTLTLAAVGQYVDFGANFEIGKAYLVVPALTGGEAADIRMQNEVAFWAAGLPADDTYLQDAPFVFRYDGGILKFVLMEGVSAAYTVNIYELSGNHGISGDENQTVVMANGQLAFADALPLIPVSSGILDGVVREVASENLIPFNFFRTFSVWDAFGLSGVEFNACKHPVKQSEYGIDQWPARATLLQGASRVSDGFIQRAFTIPQDASAHDFTMWIRRSYDALGNIIVEPQHNDITVSASRYVDFEAELTGGASDIGGGRVRLDLQAGTIEATSLDNYSLGIYVWEDWYHVVISLTNDSTHDGFRVRVYPASGDTSDPSQVNTELTGWVIIDWAQFEDAGGTFAGSSPIVGGETRIIEEFTSALADGDFYRLDGMEHVATLTGGSLIWDAEDGVYKNLLYSSELMIGDVVARNMHEFGLVESSESPPSADMLLYTSNIYPIETIEEYTTAIRHLKGRLMHLFTEEYEVGFTNLAGELRTVLRFYDNFQPEEYETAITNLSGLLKEVLITYGNFQPEEYETAFENLTGTLRDQLITNAMDVHEYETAFTNLGGELLTP